MTVKVLINSADAADQAALVYATRAAKRLRTDLFAFSAMPRPETMVVYSGMDGAVAMSYNTVDVGREEQARRREVIDEMFAHSIKDEGMISGAAQLQHFSDFPAYQAVREAVIGGPLIIPRSASGNDQALANAFSRVLMEARLPVVLAPQVASATNSAIIAWDGSAEASRAVRFHLDLIKAHDRVLIAQNPDDISSVNAGAHSDPDRLKTWLEAHQLRCELAVFSGKIGEGLQELAAKESADLIVCGAYGHSRIGEFFFGGATRDLLKTEAGPALALAH